MHLLFYLSVERGKIPELNPDEKQSENMLTFSSHKDINFHNLSFKPKNFSVFICI